VAEIYIVEDDDNIRELVLYAMKTAEFAARGFECAEEFDKAMAEKYPDLILLDIMLPDESGIAVLHKLKENRKTEQIPVIMVTAKSGEYDRVKGLDSGADDYITKPFSVLELLSRIRAVLRRTGRTEQASTLLKCGNVKLNIEKHTVEVEGKRIDLTYKEFEMLSLLMGNAEMVFSRDRILSAVWGTGFEYETRTVDMHIKTLRQKLGIGGAIIKTVRGVGYKAGD